MGLLGKRLEFRSAWIVHRWGTNGQPASVRKTGRFYASKKEAIVDHGDAFIQMSSDESVVLGWHKQKET